MLFYYRKKNLICHGRIVTITLNTGKTDKFPEKVGVKIVRILENLALCYPIIFIWAFCERLTETVKKRRNLIKSQKQA